MQVSEGLSIDSKVFATVCSAFASCLTCRSRLAFYSGLISRFVTITGKRSAIANCAKGGSYEGRRVNKKKITESSHRSVSDVPNERYIAAGRGRRPVQSDMPTTEKAPVYASPPD
jgi:hypothetical protein